ncbi:hypothetical protein OOK48_35295 [Streptomyces viridodiastaticus]|uniref:deazapurine DNA modification protein DpdA family protein n=1 Tax=Streptomyces albogriseolus TaxID=1887 RepID=UPI002259438A|nr:hypothetical protein [Streptomyces viridodiastaticus]MCX4571588.1 hypothetical protein [Streptomyces viridodiastaticus]
MKARLMLGIPEPSWLWRPHPGLEGVVLFPSLARCDRRKTPFPRALHNYCLDSGGFKETQKYGRWRTTAAEHAGKVRRISGQLGRDRLLWAAPQDLMCEPWVIYGKNQHLPATHDDYFHGTRALRGLKPGEPEQDLTTAVRIHQQLTVNNFLQLLEVAPDLPFIPVLQGWTLDDYFHCKALYEQAGINLLDYPVVGLGSVCRRQDTDEIARIVDALSSTGLRLHGFGVKTDGLSEYGDQLVSADSQAWSYGYRRRNIKLPQCTHRARNCSYCLEGALAWYRRVKDAPPSWRQMALGFGEAA